MPTPVSPPFPKEGQGWFVIFIELTLICRLLECGGSSLPFSKGLDWHRCL